ncbi:MAG: HAD-IA family hydrolase [Christensenella sp.]
MAYTTVIFDLDGTLLNTLEDLADSLNYVLAKRNHPTRTINEVRDFVGNGVQVLCERALPRGAAKSEKTAVAAEFRARYKAHLQDKTRPYDGIIKLLEELAERGVKTAVVSNKFDAAVKALCGEYFGGLIGSAAGESETVRKKPDPDMVLQVIKELGGELSQTLYVGDSEVDVQTAQNVGIKCVGVTWGFRDKQVLINAGADYIAKQPCKLIGIVQGEG